MPMENLDVRSGTHRSSLELCSQTAKPRAFAGLLFTNFDTGSSVELRVLSIPHVIELMSRLEERLKHDKIPTISKIP
jgi:hypothetical protein